MKEHTWWGCQYPDGRLFRYLWNKQPEQFNTKEQAAKFATLWRGMRLTPVCVKLVVVEKKEN